MSVTRITVTQTDGRPRLSLSSGLLRPQPVHSRPGWARIGLLATTAVLLGGDCVELEVVVGAGARLDLFDVAGTVALDGRGHEASWHTRLTVAEGATLRWSGQPFVVSDGASVTRTLRIEAAEGAQVLIRDTVVLGRTGQLGGSLRNQTAIRVNQRPVCLEDQELEPHFRTLPGMLGGHRVLDTVTVLGQAHCSTEPQPGLAQFALVDQASSLTRYLGTDLSRSPLHARWSQLMETGSDPRPTQPAGVS